MFYINRRVLKGKCILSFPGQLEELGVEIGMAK